MRKPNLFKGIACGLMLTVIVGTSVFAGTVDRAARLKNVGTYSDYYSGDVGHVVELAPGSNYVKTLPRDYDNSRYN